MCRRSGSCSWAIPDRGVLKLLTSNRTHAYTSGFTGATAVPYPDALFPGHPYTGESLERDFAAVLARVAPTLVLAPTPRDAHPDHRAAGLLASAAVARLAGGAQLRFWIVHGGEGWPSPRGLEPGLPLTPAPRIRGVTPAVFALEPAEEDRKLAALRAYDTQLRTLDAVSARLRAQHRAVRCRPLSRLLRSPRQPSSQRSRAPAMRSRSRSSQARSRQ